jgi:isopentenyl-diphosphate delta-isomerase
MVNGANMKVSADLCSVWCLFCTTGANRCKPVDYILFIKANVDLDINKNEVKDTKYVTPDELRALFADPEVKVTPWFKLICESMLFEWWEHLDSGLEKFTNEQEIRRM